MGMELTERQRYVWTMFFTDKTSHSIWRHVDIDMLVLDDDVARMIELCNRLSTRTNSATIRMLPNDLRRLVLEERFNPDSGDELILGAIYKMLNDEFPTRKLIQSESTIHSYIKYDFHGTKEIYSIYYAVANSIAYFPDYHRAAQNHQKYGIRGHGGSAYDYIMSIMENCKDDFDAIRLWLGGVLHG